MRGKRSLTLYVFGGTLGSVFSVAVRRALLPSVGNISAGAAAFSVWTSVLGFAGLLFSIVLVAFALCSLKDRWAILPPVTVGALYALAALALLVLPETIAGFFNPDPEVGDWFARLARWGVLGMLIGVALGVGLGVLTENMHLGIRMLIMGGLTLVLIGMIKSGVLNGVLRIDQILLPTGLFPAFAAEYAAFGGGDGRAKRFAAPLAQLVQPDMRANTEILRALERLAKLCETSVLTDGEFERKKTELLGRM